MTLMAQERSSISHAAPSLCHRGPGPGGELQVAWISPPLSGTSWAWTVRTWSRRSLLVAQGLCRRASGGVAKVLKVCRQHFDYTAMPIPLKPPCWWRSCLGIVRPPWQKGYPRLQSEYHHRCRHENRRQRGYLQTLYDLKPESVGGAMP